MAVVKINTEVDDASFNKFLESFKRYQTAFAKQPDVWGAVAGSAEDANKSFAEAADSMRALSDSMDGVLGRSRNLEDTTKRTVTYWERLGRATKLVSNNVTSTTSSLFTLAKWTGGAALAGGLAVAAGGAALYGIDTLGHSVARQRSTAMGLGTSYGGLASARANYARFGDADSALARVNAAQTDPSNPGRLGFNALGIKNYETRDSADVLAEVLEKSKKFLDDTPKGLLANRLETSGLGSLYDIGTAQRIQGASAGEVGGVSGRMRSDRGGLELGADAQKKWQDFSTQLSRAGEKIETVLVNRLVALAPGLNKLSESVTHLAQEALKKDGPVSQWLGELNTGLQNLSGEIDKPEFQTRVKEFMHGVADIAGAVYGFGKKIADLAHWFAGIVGPESGVSALATGSAGERYGGSNSGSGYHAGRRGLTGNGKVDLAGISAVDKTIPAEGRALLDTLASGEAHGYNVMNGGGTFSDYSRHPGGRAAGRYQDLPSTWRGIQQQTGIKDFSPESQDKGNWFLAQRDYRARTGRDLLTDLKSKDPGRVRAIGQALHSTWISTNSEFEGKYEKFKSRVDGQSAAPLAKAAPRPPVKVTIQKNTGANPATSAAAMAAPP